MKTRLLLLIAACTATVLHAGYSYDFTGLLPDYRFTANGAVDYDYSGGIDFYADAGSFIYQPAVSVETVGGVSGSANDYEVSMSLYGPSSTVIEFLRASSDAMRSNGSATGSFVSVEYTGWAGNLTINQSVSGTLTQLASLSIGYATNRTLRSIVWGTTLWVFLDGNLVYSNTGIPATTGQPGIGGFQGHSGETATEITSVSIGHHDIAPPATPNASTLRSSVLPTSASLAWEGVADDAAGIGLYRYNVSRNGTPLTYILGTPVLTDSTVSPSTSYTYTIMAVDYHGNSTPAVNYVITTPAASSIDARRTGLYTTGSYWGGGGEQIDTLSGNLNFSFPLVSAMGRTGWNVPVGLSYNSQNWRYDGSYSWSLGTDTGFGYGWSMQIGSITPYYAGWTSGVDHYVFTDGSGAAYRLDQNHGNIWSSLQGIYVWFDANTNRVYFKNGKFWVMGCTSSGGEQDAGTMYPTLVEDPGGNQVIVTYQAAVGLPSAMTNTSARILTMEDARAAYMGSYPAVHYLTYQFSYNTDPIPHLTSVANYIGSPETFPTFNYAENVPLAPPSSAPFSSTDPNYSGVTTTHLTSIVTPASGPTSTSYPAAGKYSFTYDSSGSGELTQVTFPYGGHLRWVYSNANYSGGRVLREVSSRYLSVDGTGAGAEWNPYLFTHSDTLHGGTIATVHTDTMLADASGVGAKEWLFNTSSSTWLPNGSWQIGLISGFQQLASALTGATTITDDTYIWSQTGGSTVAPIIGAEPYIWKKTHVLDPGGSNQQSALSVQTLDPYGNLAEEDLYPFNNTSTILQKVQSSFMGTSSYTANYILDRLLTTTVTDSGGVVHTPVQNLYDNAGYNGLPVASPCGGSLTFFGAPYNREIDTSAPGGAGYRGLLIQSTSPLKTTCYQYDGLSNMIEADGSDGSKVSVPASSSTNYAAPTSLTTESYNYSLSYNAWLGLTGTTGANGENVSMSYDSYGRPNVGTTAYGGYIWYLYPNGTTGQPTVLPTYQMKQMPSGSSGSESYTVLDGVGHAIQTMVVDLATGPQSYTSSIYAPCACSPMGKVQMTSQPTAVSGSPSPWTLQSTTGLAGTAYVYDGIGRTLRVTQPDGVSTTHYSYSGNQTTVTDPDGNWKTFTTDVLGNLTTVSEPDPCVTSSTLTTSYTYDWANHVTLVSMARPVMTFGSGPCTESGSPVTQTRTFSYNDAGQLTSAINPENGTTTYTYGTNGLVATKVDANGQTTGYAYNTSNQLIGVNHSPGGTLDPCQTVSYTWGSDPTSYNYSRLSGITYGTLSVACPEYPGGLPTSFSESYGYTAAGDIASSGLGIQRGWPDYSGDVPSGGSEPVNYSYDAYGRRTGMQYFGFDPFNSSSGPPDTWPPSMVNLAYSYDHQGRISGMTDGTATWVQGVTYDVAGRMTSLQYPQNSSTFGYMTEAKTFNTNGQLASMTWTPAGSGTGLPSGTISYAYTSTTHTGNNGQVASTTDGVSGETISYQYDVLKRLTSASSSPTSGTTPAAWSQGYVYDGFGNLTSKGSGLTIPVNSGTNQLMNEAIGGVNILSNVSYDSNGNLLSVTNGSAPELTMTYDGSNRVLTAAVGTSGTEYYGYDANNRRIYRRLTSGAEEWTLYGGNGENLGTFQFYEQCEDPDDPGDCWWEPLTLSTNIWFGSKLIWSGTGSWSGSTTVFADRNGTNRASGARFYPYGDEITSTGNDRVKFATYRRSSFTGLDYADQRYYASSYGRFMSVDSGAVSTKDPVTWNRYTYTGGDPINRNDPRGTCWGNNSDGRDLIMEDWDWDYGEQWTDPGWVHTPGGCLQGPEYEAALAACGEGVDWSPSGYNCDDSAAPPAQPSQPAPSCSISLYERSAGGTPANHTYLVVSGMVNGQYVDDVLEGNPANKGHPRLRNPFSKGWPPLQGYIEPVAGGVFNGPTNPATNFQVDTDTGSDMCGDIATLEQAIGSYKKGPLAPYMPIPGKGFYNSNSFTYTLLYDIGLENPLGADIFPEPPGWNPGWGKIVPGLN